MQPQPEPVDTGGTGRFHKSPVPQMPSRTLTFEMCRGIGACDDW